MRTETVTTRARAKRSALWLAVFLTLGCGNDPGQTKVDTKSPPVPKIPADVRSGLKAKVDRPVKPGPDPKSLRTLPGNQHARYDPVAVRAAVENGRKLLREHSGDTEVAGQKLPPGVSIGMTLAALRTVFAEGPLGRIRSPGGLMVIYFASGEDPVAFTAVLVVDSKVVGASKKFVTRAQFAGSGAGASLEKATWDKILAE